MLLAGSNVSAYPPLALERFSSVSECQCRSNEEGTVSSLLRHKCRVRTECAWAALRKEDVNAPKLHAAEVGVLERRLVIK